LLGINVALARRSLAYDLKPRRWPDRLPKNTLKEVPRLLAEVSDHLPPFRPISDAFHRAFALNAADLCQSPSPEVAKRLLDWAYKEIPNINKQMLITFENLERTSSHEKWVSATEALLAAGRLPGLGMGMAHLSKLASSSTPPFKFRRPLTREGKPNTRRLDVELGSFLVFLLGRQEDTAEPVDRPTRIRDEARGPTTVAASESGRDYDTIERRQLRDLIDERSRNDEAQRSIEAARVKAERAKARAEWGRS
jgi:hypothetical protein